MLIHKIGYEHSQEWKNCQDFGFIDEKVKCVVDGCSEGLHSEVGAKLFCQLFQKTRNADESFQLMLPLFSTFEDIKQHLLFTILYVLEDDENFYVYAAGDGYVIKRSVDDVLSYEKIDFDNSPPYYAYNFVDKKYLKKYQEGVVFELRSYAKSDYKSIGVATDGLHYVLRSEMKEPFEQALLEDKKFNILRLFNRDHPKLKDDITIAM
jgi:hypothetical protein